MDFKEYYKNRAVVNSYDSLRGRGLKGRITRMLERAYVDILIPHKKDQNILEIGVGTGFIGQLLSNKGKFTGLDVSKEMLKTAAKNIKKPTAKFITGDILNLKVPRKFDSIVTIRVISHFDKKNAIVALQNISRVLDKNGRVVFNLENISRIRILLRRIRKWGSTLNYQYSEKEVYEICSKAGLDIERIIYLDHFFILPLHLLNKLFFNKLEKSIFKIEMALKNLRFTSNNFFIKCKKQ